MSKILMMARHSEPEFSGEDDSGLSKRGIGFAANTAAQAIEDDYIPDVIYYSDVARVKETALCFQSIFEKAARRSIEILPLEGLKLINWETPTSEILAQFKEESRVVMGVTHHNNVIRSGFDLAQGKFESDHAIINIATSDEDSWKKIDRMKLVKVIERKL